MSMVELVKDRHYTYADYLTWNDDKRREIINGVVYEMAAPTLTHQRIVMWLSNRLYNFIEGRNEERICEIFVSPVDVRLAKNQFDDIIVQPDLIMVCDPAKLEDDRCCTGVPDMAVEIVSKSSAQRDRIIKLNLYRKAGVREYWIVDPEEKTVMVCLLDDGKYVVNAYGYGYDEEGEPLPDVIPVTILEGCEIHLSEIFS